MFTDFIFYTVISFFSIYGFLHFILYCYDFYKDVKTLKNKVVYTVVAVKNEEEKVEGIARALLIKAIRNDSGIADNKVVILDCGSEDKTTDIVKKLQNEDKGILLMNYEELAKDIEKNL